MLQYAIWLKFGNFKLLRFQSSRSQESQFLGLGGPNLGQAVKHVVSCAISHKMQLQMNWIGRIGWRAKDDQACKTGLKETHLCKVMIGR